MINLQVTCIKDYDSYLIENFIALKLYEVDIELSSLEDNYIWIRTKDNNPYVFSFSEDLYYPKFEDYFIKPNNLEDVIKNYKILK